MGEISEKFLERYNYVVFDVGGPDELDEVKSFFKDYGFDDGDEDYFFHISEVDSDDYLAICFDPDSDTNFHTCGKNWFDDKEYLEDDFVKNGMYRFYPDVLEVKDLRKLKTMFDTGRVLLNRPMYSPRKFVYENTKVVKFDEFDNLEYRKGSKEFGGLLTKVLEYLRLVRKEEKELTFNLDDFVTNSNITKEELETLIKAKEDGKNLFDFSIELNDNTVTFSGFDSGKSRPFESLDAIRTEYEDMGVEDFYKKKGNEYINPHLGDIEKSVRRIDHNSFVDMSNVLDLACGTGEVTNILNDLDYYNIEGVDLYLCNEYEKNTEYKCTELSFQDIQQGKLKDKKYSTIFCSYALHLADKSILHDLLWELSLISDYLVIISPTKKPEISEDSWELEHSFIEGKSKVRIFYSKNNNI